MAHQYCAIGLLHATDLLDVRDRMATLYSPDDINLDSGEFYLSEIGIGCKQISLYLSPLIEVTIGLRTHTVENGFNPIVSVNQRVFLASSTFYVFCPGSLLKDGEVDFIALGRAHITEAIALYEEALRLQRMCR